MTGTHRNKFLVAVPGLMVLMQTVTPSPAHAQTTPGAPRPSTGSTQSWVTYKGNLQRTAGRDNALTLPLNLIWQHSTLAPPKDYYTSPLVVGPAGQRRIYFPAGRTIVCIDSQTGALLWRSREVSSPINAPITLLSGGEMGDLILVVTTGGRLSALRTADGGQAWESDARAAVFGTAPTFVNTPNGERIIVGNATGALVAFTREGVLDTTWKVTLGRSAPNSTPALSPDGTRLFVTTSDRKVFAIDLQRGAVAYGVPVKGSPTGPPAVLDDRVIIAAGRVITALKDNTGESIWTTDIKEPITASPAVRADADGNHVIYIGTTRGNFFAIDAQQGRVLWKTDLQSAVTGTAVVLPGSVLVGTDNGVFYALGTGDGKVLWQYRLRTERLVTTKVTTRAPKTDAGGAAPAASTTETKTVKRALGVSSLPSVVGSQVYLLADNAALYAFDTAPFDADPPIAIQPSLSVPTKTGGLTTFLMDANSPRLAQGKGPIYFSVQLEDQGSGVDPASLKFTFDGQELDVKNLNFHAGRGVATATLVPKGDKQLTDGLKSLTFTARDYRGNPMTYTTSLMVDNSMAPPAGAAPKPRPEPAQGAGGAG